MSFNAVVIRAEKKRGINREMNDFIVVICSAILDEIAERR